MLSSVEKLQKFIKLEVERGYDNRAVVGGLDKILPAWENDARANHLSEDTIQMVITGLKEYPFLEPQGRAETLARLMSELESAAANVPAENGEEQETFQTNSSESESPRQRLENEDAPGSYNRPSGPRSGAKSYPSSKTQTGDATGLNAPLRVLQGVGGRTAQTLSSIGLNTLEDLLYYFPRRYDDYSQLKPINRLEFGEVTTVLGTIQSIHMRPIRSGKLQMTEAVITDGTGSLRVNWFNQPWMVTRFSQGTQVVLSGKVEQYLGRLTMTNPEMEQIEAEHLHTNRIVPVYPLTSRLTQKSLRRMMYQTVAYWAPRVTDYLPEKIRNSVKLVNLSTALINVHFPESTDMLDVARWRLAFDEIFLLQMGVLRQKQSWRAVEAQVFKVEQDWLDEQAARLPFPLTNAQKRVIGEVRENLESGSPMERLIQGDVGSGKTVIAAIAASIVTGQGAQAAIMAPTSILAEQHYRTMTRLLAEVQQPVEAVEGSPAEESGSAPLQPEEIRLLVGDTPEAEKQEIRNGLLDGSIKIIIGTHALIEGPVQFQNLQLAVIDEQHRFGVAQRAALRAKGQNLHLLVMTATPIPRSLALTVYGDLDISVLDELPPGRQPVTTAVLRPVEHERAYTLIQAQIDQGRQAFIIYPMVEQGDEEDLQFNGKTDVSAARLAAVEEQARLQREVFPKRKIGLLHGRMKPDEKDAVMRQFRDREFDILVSTTVVEVGVDVPNATVMLIEGANRFGLAQLHQLRGRVGRGSSQSYCLLIPDREDAVENERLAVMASTNDGFVLAEHDLQQRGPGDFLGTRQAGFAELRMANLTDVRLIEKARQQAQALFQEDPNLESPEYQPLRTKLEQFWDNGRGDIS